MSPARALPTPIYLAISTLTCTLVVAGCSGSSSTNEDSTTTPVSEPAAVSTPAVVSTPAEQSSSTEDQPGTGACSYLTVDQASQLAASPVKAGDERSITAKGITFDYCDYIFDPGNAPGVSVAIARLPGDPASLFQQFRADKQASDSQFQDVSGVGDAAFYANQNLNILSGDTGVIIFVGRANGTPRGLGNIPDEKAAAEIILPQL